MSNFINSVDALGDSVVADSIITKTITEFKDNVVTKVGYLAFANCNQLSVVDLPSVTIIEQRAFQLCSNLTAVILRNEEIICSLQNSNGFYNASIAKGTGYIYAPRALLSDDDSTKDYRRATNWSKYSAQFRILENFTVDGTITGELDTNKI